MQALERVMPIPSWITLLVIFCCILLVLLKMINSQNFFGVLASLRNKGFLEIESEEKISSFNLFTMIFSLFSVTIMALVVYVSVISFTNTPLSLNHFISIALFVSSYAIGRFLVDIGLAKLFDINRYINILFLSKQAYLFSISVGVLAFVVLYLYTNMAIFWLWIGVFFLFLVRFFLLIINNKKLIASNLFYIILYLCALELAPLLIFFKLITN